MEAARTTGTLVRRLAPLEPEPDHRCEIANWAFRARRRRVIELLQDWGLVRGTQVKIARKLQVHPSTISCDVSRILKIDGTNRPTCEGWITHKEWGQLRKKGDLLPRDKSA